MHSADKWFFNPFEYDEPAFHQNGMDNPDNACLVVLSDEQLLEYLMKIRKKTCDYLDTLTDDMLYEKPELTAAWNNSTVNFEFQSAVGEIVEAILQQHLF